MKASYEPQNAFEGYVLERLDTLENYHTNHMAHHRAIYGRLWTVAVLIFVGIVSLWFK